MESLSKFMSEFKRGFQQADRFLCQIIVTPTMIRQMIQATLPQRGAPLVPQLERALSAETSVASIPQIVKWLAQGYLVSNARLPDRGYGFVDQSMYGYTEHFPYHTEYSALALTFQMPYVFNISNDNAVPRFFNYWQNHIQHGLQGPDSGYDFSFPDNYYATIVLTLLDRKNHGTISYQFDKAYPKTVSSNELSWSQPDTFVSLPVEFNFSYWKVLPVAESFAVSLVDKLVSGVIPSI